MTRDTHNANAAKRCHLAQQLHEAHLDQRRNVRALEESYHALRTSSRLLDRRYSSYIALLEEELQVRSWRDVREVSNVAQLVQYQTELDIQNEITTLTQNATARQWMNKYYSAGDIHRTSAVNDSGYDSQPMPTDKYQHTLTGEHSAFPRTRSPSSTLQQHQGPWMPSPSSDQGYQSLSLPFHDATSQDRSSPPRNQAMMPIREQLVELSERARQGLRSQECPAQPSITVTPASPPQPRGHIDSIQTSQLNRHAVVASPRRILPTAVKQQEMLMGVRTPDQKQDQMLPPIGSGRPTTHEANYHRPGVLGHFGSVETTKTIQVGTTIGSVGSLRRRLHKTPPKFTYQEDIKPSTSSKELHDLFQVQMKKGLSKDIAG
ncbi:MAG: hypothetical protein Q9222_001688 [Ikaeria aurantiellina]